MLLDPRVHELLSMWEEAGDKVSPEELCAACPELLGELREHIDRLRSTDRVMNAPDDHDESVEPAPQIDGYRILSPLGRGGMGIVWRAVQLSTGRDVALKVMSAGAFASERARQRFEREVELTARLQHPNIARLYDSGVCRGLHYYAMELIEGVPLDDYVEQRAVSRDDRLELMRTVCRAVQHAHQRGVIHRDLKPSNILVTADGQPHVLDFGLAKTILTETSPALSLDDVVPGTPAFMSPEQAAGDVNRIDVRCDVYSLGVILFRLLLPEHWPHDQSGSYVQLMRRIADIPARRPRQLDASIDSDLDALVAHALEHKAENRCASADQLADDIGRYLAGDPLLYARRQTAAYRLGKMLKKHRLRVTLAALAILILTGAATLAYVENAGQRRRAEVAFAAETAADRFMQNMLSAAAPEVGQGQELTVLQVLERASNDVRVAFPNQPLVEAGVRGMIGRTYTQLSRIDDAEVHLKRAREIRRNLLGDNDPETLRAAQDLAFLYETAFRLDEARQLTSDTLQRRRRTLGSMHVDTLTSVNSLGNVLSDEERYPEARKLLQEAYDGRLTLLGPRNADTLWSMNDLAIAMFKMGDQAEALPLMKKCYALRLETMGETHPDTLNGELDLAMMIGRSGQAEEGERMLRHDLKLRRAVYKEGTLPVSLAYHDLGELRERAGDLDEAADLYRKAYEIRKIARGEQGKETVKSRAALIHVLREQHKVAEAAQLERAGTSPAPTSSPARP